ncbi:hypothetical protein [Sinorhizobium meliloti]|uniref:hypothetical protein n=1 Tax=Rhizobium meliloti TaxID=382 RepID=UPI000FDA4C31|nr:hypothetical protein [Sinorhizobium meliloti]RVK30848.1 hypothetical protein CN163_26820 [Sinorhizobium meliloti]
MAAKALNLAPSQHTEEPIKAILGGAMSLVTVSVRSEIDCPTRMAEGDACETVAAPCQFGGEHCRCSRNIPRRNPSRKKAGMTVVDLSAANNLPAQSPYEHRGAASRSGYGLAASAWGTSPVRLSGRAHVRGSAMVTIRCWQSGQSSNVSRKRGDPDADEISTLSIRHLSIFLKLNRTSQPAHTQVGFAMPVALLIPRADTRMKLISRRADIFGAEMLTAQVLSREQSENAGFAAYLSFLNPSGVVTAS